jgi:glutamine amidotransferase
MQLLFEGSDEAPGQPGLDLLPGWVRRFENKTLKIPQTGWNQVTPTQVTPLLRDLPADRYAYFNHSYYCAPTLGLDGQISKDCLALTDYGLDYASVVGRGRLYGVQFHPEKSQAVGLTILRNFVEHC